MAQIISKSKQEIQEDQQHQKWASHQKALHIALNSNLPPEKMAQALKDYELPKRTKQRFIYEIDWNISENKPYWTEVKAFYFI